MLIILLLLHSSHLSSAALQEPHALAKVVVSNVPVHAVRLRQKDPSSPFCFVATSAMQVANKQRSNNNSNNFLATQVWPSARVAADMIEQHADPSWSVCEFGCGPGLPALTAACLQKRHYQQQQQKHQQSQQVYATDLDEFALELVQAAAHAQSLENLSTQKFDLTNDDDDTFPLADLYILSDVFESSQVAQGAALVSQKALEQGSRVWVFAQTDRAQREKYLEAMRNALGSSSLSSSSPSLDWSPPQAGPPAGTSLWLCDVDETRVNYD